VKASLSTVVSEALVAVAVAVVAPAIGGSRPRFGSASNSESKIELFEGVAGTLATPSALEVQAKKSSEGNNPMKKRFFGSFSLAVLIAITCAVPATSYAQTDGNAKAGSGTTPSATGPAITATTSPVDLAKAALAAQGGEKFKALKSMVLRGSVDLFAPNSTQSIPGGFIWVVAGDKVRVEVDARPAVAFKQIYDGERSYSSLPGVELPPASKFGLALLAKYDQPGYTVTALPDKKKQRGFRISDADGNTTDFYLDSSNGRVMSFLIPYGGYTFGTENKKFKEIDGVLVPVSFTQRLEMAAGAFFAAYSVKDVKLNTALGDDVFAIPN
jgi:hypothetical protein